MSLWCEKCDKEWSQEELGSFDRGSLQSGQRVPVGSCPACGAGVHKVQAYAFLDNDGNESISVEALGPEEAAVKVLESMGWSQKGIAIPCHECGLLVKNDPSDEDTFFARQPETREYVPVCQACYHQNTYNCHGCGDDFLYAKDQMVSSDGSVCGPECRDRVDGASPKGLA